MAEDRLIRWGILGCGHIAHTFAEGLKSVPDAILEAVASKSGKAEPFGKKFGVRKCFKRYEQLVKDSSVDIIYVATTHNFHFENILLCLDFDKPALSEKPFTINASQASELINKAKDRGIFLMEGMWTRFLPSVVKIRQLIHHEKILGEIIHFKGDYCVNLPYANASTNCESAPKITFR